MPVKSLGHYDFPSSSRQELYGDDQLVHVWFADNPWFCSAACFRAPQAMSWDEFWSALVVPFAEEDPDFDPAAPRSLQLHGAPFRPEGTRTLAELGVAHKDVIAVRAG